VAAAAALSGMLGRRDGGTFKFKLRPLPTGTVKVRRSRSRYPAAGYVSDSTVTASAEGLVHASEPQPPVAESGRPSASRIVAPAGPLPSRQTAVAISLRAWRSQGALM
jgi:hypothetical protein